jgi:glycosyltransferase involved in cell wall biosynthesis
VKISVVVPSGDRPLRLRWLLNALEEQILPREQWEVLVAHDSDYGDLVAAHPVGAREIRLPPCGPSAKRNAGWRAARAPLIAFTDDDCRPPPEWLANALAAAEAAPGAIVQGATRPDPDELLLLQAPHARTMVVDPPSPEAQTCNIVYPRDVLEALDGFDEERVPLVYGEDVDLAWRAREAGVAQRAAPEALMFHMVRTMSLAERVAFGWRWRQLPATVQRHPGLRRHAVLGVFWNARHGWFLLALAGAAAATRRGPLALSLALPWARAAMPRYGGGPRGRLRAMAELPGQVAIDAVEVAAFAAGSVKARTVFL